MMYGEIIIGPPGSGKSTYAEYKKEVLKDRKVFTVNLDPGNNKSGFNYDIKTVSTTQQYMQSNECGPNYSVKCILNNFVNDYDSFRKIIYENQEAYFIFDFPGQVEFFVSDSCLRTFCRYLLKEGMYLVVVQLVDISFFIEKHTLFSTYLMSTIALILLEMPHVCVMSKCDLAKNFNIKNFEDVLMGCNLQMNSKMEDKFKFYQNVIDLVENEGLLSYEVLDYENIDSLMYLQMIIDKASGYFFNEEPYYEPVYKEDILAKYENQ